MGSTKSESAELQTDDTAWTREDKKREILNYIHSVPVDEGEYLSLERDTLKERFSDEYYSQEQIGEIIEELIENEPVNSDEYKLEIVYPDRLEGDISESLTVLSKFSLPATFVVGYYFLLMILTSTEVFNQIFYGMSDGQLLSISILGTISAYYIGVGSLFIIGIINENIPIIRKHKYFFYPTIILIAIGFFIAWFLSLSRSVPPFAYVSIIPTSALAGASIARYMDNKSNES